MKDCKSNGAAAVLNEDQPPEGAPISTTGEWRKAWQRFKVSSWSLESDVRRELSNPRVLGHEHLQDLKSEAQRVDDERATWEQDIWCGSAKMRQRILALAQTLPFMRDATQARELVAGAERDLAILQEQRRLELEELTLHECTLQDTLESLTVRFEGWASQPSALKKTADEFGVRSLPRTPSRGSSSWHAVSDTKAAVESQCDADLRARIDALMEEEVREGSSTGGWPKDDHDAFMRLLHKSSGRRADAVFLQRAQELLPHHTHEKLVEHVNWLTGHERRKSEQRELVAEWRKRRALQGAAAEAESSAPQQALTAEQAEAEKKRVRDLARQKELDMADQKQRVADWKAARAAEQVKLLSAQMDRELDQKKRSESAKLKRIAQQRKAIIDFRQKRIDEKAKENIAQRSASETARRQPSSSDLQRIAQRNEAMFEKCVRAKAEKSYPLRALQNFQPPSRNAYAHVASRVYEDAEAHSFQRSRSTSDLDRTDASKQGSSPSKYAQSHGNWAHQGMVRAARALPAWRPQYGA